MTTAIAPPSFDERPAGTRLLSHTEPVYACLLADGLPALFRPDTFAAALAPAAVAAGLPAPPESLLTDMASALVHRWRGRIGTGANGVHVRPALSVDDHGTPTVALMCHRAGGNLEDPFTPRTLNVRATTPRVTAPPIWQGHANLSPDGTLCLPPGTHVFFRYPDRLLALPGEQAAPSATSSAIRELAATLGLHTTHGATTVAQLWAGATAGNIREAFVCAEPPALVPLGAVRFGAHRFLLGTGQPGPTFLAIWRRLTAVLHGKAADRKRWMRPARQPLATGQAERS